MKLLSRALQGAPPASTGLPVHSIIDATRQLNDQHRRALHPQSGMAASMWAKWHATVHIKAGRQVGYTSYIIDHATSNSVIVCHDRNAAVHLTNQLAAKGIAPLIVPHTDLNQLRGIQSTVVKMWFDTIYVDDASSYSEHVMDDVYQTLAIGHVSQQFVLLG